MNDSPVEHRFHEWLVAQAPRSAPPGLLARSMDAVGDAPAQRGRWPWPVSRAVVLVPAISTVVVLTLVAALIWSSMPRTPVPVGEATPSPTAETTPGRSESPTESASVAPSRTGSPTATPEATSLPTVAPTPIVFPSAAPSPTPVIVGPAGTLTFRLVLNSLPAGTQKIWFSFGFARDVPLVVTPEDAPDSGGAFYTLCGGEAKEPCSAPRTYEQTFSGFEPNALTYYAVGASLGSDESWYFAEGQLPASGYLVVASYPTADSTGPRGSCVGDLLNHRRVHGVVEYDGSGPYAASEDLCLLSLVWSMGDGFPWAGTVSLTRDGQPVYSIDLAHFNDGLTWSHVGSGEFMVVFNPPIPVYGGQVLDLDFSDCPDCRIGSLGAWLVAAAP